MFFSHDTVADENERLRQELKRCKAEKSMLQTQVTQLKQGADRDAAYRQALEREHEALRTFICSSFGLPPSTGVVDIKNTNAPTMSYAQRSHSLPETTTEPSAGEATKAVQVLKRSVEALNDARTPSGARKGERTVRLQEDWTMEENTIAPTEFGLGSLPWTRLLTDWAQGDAKKLDYLTQWLGFHLQGKKDARSPFANPRVELKSMNSNMLAGFLQLVVPALQASRPDVDVNVYTKDYVGHSLRIVLEEKPRRSAAIHNAATFGSSRGATFGSSRGSLLAPIQEHVSTR
ncbi:Aste57867_23293 [Aphanomyces stellatus]|uniref:Aste57867_23293 protein n=1 Tax=Aphanomyces stellatus TaxID=120398 RepID=A0A485LP04_9STRA|nr:hypothetical protein As57867_023222 [Aphanomyces stellatus]VFT99938.1 Aste57867_23293 [Aphanomyces stellatus]